MHLLSPDIVGLWLIELKLRRFSEELLDLLLSSEIFGLQPFELKLHHRFSEELPDLHILDWD